MDPTVVPVPRRVRLRPGRFCAPAWLGWLFQTASVAAIYELTLPLWLIFCFCFQGHNPNLLPKMPWHSWFGLEITSPGWAVLHMTVWGLLLFAFRLLGEILVWKGLRERDLLVTGRAMLAKVVATKSEGSKQLITYSFVKDGTKKEAEVAVSSTYQKGQEIAILCGFHGENEMLYDQNRFEVAPRT